MWAVAASFGDIGANPGVLDSDDHLLGEPRVLRGSSSDEQDQDEEEDKARGSMAMSRGEGGWVSRSMQIRI